MAKWQLIRGASFIDNDELMRILDSAKIDFSDIGTNANTTKRYYARIVPYWDSTIPEVFFRIFLYEK